MAKPRPRIPASIKRALVEQTGGKCANPGCPGRLTQLHHIEEWHVYETHAEEHMICVCASCHDEIHRGALPISDGILYRWKGIDRSAAPTGHLFIEPGEPARLLVGSVSVEGDSGVVVFDFAERHRLSFAVRDGDLMLLSAAVTTLDGAKVVDIVDGYVKHLDSEVELQLRAGRVRVPGSINDERFVPGWARHSLLAEDVLTGVGGLPILDLEVVRPGVVRVQGVWIDAHRGVVITSDRLSFLSAGRERPISLVGQGEATVLHFSGLLDAAAFGV